MNLNDLFAQMEMWPLTTAVAESNFLYPLTLSFHVLAMTTLVGCIAAADLRLMGFIAKNRSVETFLAGILPWTFAALTISVVTGCLLFPSQATRYVVNPVFRAKFVFLILAGINAFVFHALSRKGEVLEQKGMLPSRARLAGACSMLLWIGVFACGRLTAYF